MHDTSRKLLNSHKAVVSFPKGKIIFTEGSEALGVYCISQGMVKTERVSRSGRLRLMNLLKSGDILGGSSIFSKTTYADSAVAEEDTVACFIPREVIVGLVEKEPLLAMKFLGDISRESKYVAERLYQFGELDVAGRVAGTLLFLKENFNTKKWTRAEIAAWAGTTAESVVRCLTQFEKKSLITLQGHRIEIQDKKALEKITHL